MTQPDTEQLLNLADRAERGPLTADEAARLRDGINALQVKLAAVREDRDRWREQARTEQADRRIAEAAIERVRAECDRIETAVTDNPTSPDIAGGYRACLRHIRAALDEHQEQTAAAPEPEQDAPLDECIWIEREPCGCIVSAVLAVVEGAWTLATAEQVTEHWHQNQRERQQAERAGLTAELITADHYREHFRTQWKCKQHATA